MQLIARLILMLLLAVPALAQTAGMIEYSNGEQVKLKKTDAAGRSAFMQSFLSGARDGHLQLTENGKVDVDIVKKGDKVTITAGGHRSETTAKQALADFQRARSKGELAMCEAQMKNIATALEMWMGDNNGKLPAQLSQLNPSYLPRNYTCPASNGAAYTAYKPGPDHYQFRCAGNHTAAGVPQGFPVYDACSGPIVSPRELQDLSSYHKK